MSRELNELMKTESPQTAGRTRQAKRGAPGDDAVLAPTISCKPITYNLKLKPPVASFKNMACHFLPFRISGFWRHYIEFRAANEVFIGFLG